MEKSKKTNKKKSDIVKRLHHVPLLIIILVAFGLRLYKINSPISGHHSWRQADTSAVTRNFIKNGVDLLRPTFDDLSPIQSGKENPSGYRMVEFPLYNFLSAKLYTLSFNTISIETAGRMVTILFSIALIVSIYIFTLHESSNIAALASALFLSIFPFPVFYSRTILPDMPAVSLTILSITILLVSLKQSRIIIKSSLIFLSLLLFSLSLLVKPTVIFYSLVLFVIIYRHYGISLLKKPLIYLFILTIIPFVLWRFWITQFPEGIPGSQWLLTSVNTPNGLEKIFFRPAFFRWVFIERIQNMILGGLSVFFLIAGIFLSKKNVVILSLGISCMLYLITFQGGNVQHDYYQIIILPAIATYFGNGMAFFFKKKYSIGTLLFNFSVISVIVSLSLFYSFYQIRHFFDTDATLLNIAQIIKTVTPENSLIVTDTTGDTTLLYLSERKGYPAPTTSWDELKKQNMDYFITTKKEVGEDLKTKLETVFESDSVYIFKL